MRYFSRRKVDGIICACACSDCRTGKEEGEGEEVVGSSPALEPDHTERVLVRDVA